MCKAVSNLQYQLHKNLEMTQGDWMQVSALKNKTENYVLV